MLDGLLVRIENEVRWWIKMKEYYLRAVHLSLPGTSERCRGPVLCLQGEELERAGDGGERVSPGDFVLGEQRGGGEGYHNGDLSPENSHFPLSLHIFLSCNLTILSVCQMWQDRTGLAATDWRNCNSQRRGSSPLCLTALTVLTAATRTPGSPLSKIFHIDKVALLSLYTTFSSSGLSVYKKLPNWKTIAPSISTFWRLCLWHVIKNLVNFVSFINSCERRNKYKIWYFQRPANSPSRQAWLFQLNISRVGSYLTSSSRLHNMMIDVLIH